MGRRIRINLKGHFCVIRHAAAYWRDRTKAGHLPNAAIVNTASASGISMRNPGQSQYGASKAGVAALTLVAADELARYGARVNAIAPIARTRLSLANAEVGAAFAAEVPEGQFDALSPANISPLVAYLASDRCSHTGKVFGVHGDEITELAGWRNVRTVRNDGAWNIDTVAANLG